MELGDSRVSGGDGPYEAEKKSLPTPGMKDVGKPGAAASSYTQLFMEKQQQRRKATVHQSESSVQDLSPAAAIFSPDDDEGTEGAVTQSAHGHPAHFPPAGRGMPAVAPPVPQSSKDERVRAWVASVPVEEQKQLDSDDDVPTATPIPAELTPSVAGSGAEIGSLRKSDIASLKSALGKTKSSAGSGDFPFNKVSAPKGLYTGQFDQLSSEGRIPAFPAAGATHVTPADDIDVDPFSKFPRARASSTRMKYTETFDKGVVPKFPTVSEASPKPNLVEEEKPKSRFCCCFWTHVK